MARKKILVIDDDVRLIRLLEEYLTGFDFDVIHATEPGPAMDLLRRANPDAVILDVMLPGKDGFTVCREIRAESMVPVIMLTARGEVTDRIVGMEMGADDYLPKPFEPRELVVRLKAVLRRSEAGTAPGGQLVFGGLRVDCDARRAWLEERELDLSTAEFQLLELLVRHPGRSFTRDELMDRMKGQEWAAFQRSVDVLVSRLRQKLADDARNPRYIRTIWGTGYRFIARRGGS